MMENKILPVLFNTEMVRAILDGRKTVTRRIIKPKYKEDEGGFCVCTNKATGERWVEKYDWEERHFDSPRYIKPPYQPGDTLYVRETWCWEPCWDCGMDTEEHNCCDGSAHKIFNHDKGEWGCYCYKASFENNVYPSVGIWHPSIHMPKEAARIWLNVTDVRVERLQKMMLGDFMAEGVVIRPEAFNDPDNACMQARNQFIGIWDPTIPRGQQDLYSWDADPWVWVIEFERCEKP